MREGIKSSLVGLGQSLGSGLIGLVENLGHEKALSIRNKQKADTLSRGFGIPFDTAYAITQQPESIQRDLFNRLEGLSVSGQQKNQNDNSISFQPKEEFGVHFGDKNNLKQEAHNLKIEARKDKIRPDLNYLDDLERTSKELRELMNQNQEPVEFGSLSSGLSSVPFGIGNQWLDASTGAFNALSNKFHTDATQGAKNVRSVYHVKLLGASKPGLDKTKAQNEKLLNHWDKVIAEKKAKFLKAHPEFLDEIEQPIQPQQQMQQQQQSSGPVGPEARDKITGKVCQWNPQTKDYDLNCR